MQLRLMHAFFLRREEAVMFKPHRADRGDHIDVEFGTKGGRHRIVPVETAYQRQVLDGAKSMVKSLNGYVGDNGKSLKQALNRFDYVCRRFGLTRSALGATSHGLRHQGLNDYFENISGKVSPIRGGTLIATTVEEELKIEKARQLVAEAAGHARLSISGAYLGGQAIIRQNRRAVPSFGSTGDERLDHRLWEMERLVHLQRRQIENNDLSGSEVEELAMLTRRALDDKRLGQQIRSAAARPAG
jgi:integrase